jgi:hypothetical protein
MSDQHLLTGGGERWPGNDCAAGDAARRPGGSSRARPGPPTAAGRERWSKRPTIREGEDGCLKWKSTGGGAKQTSKHRARDARVRRTCGYSDFGKPRCREAPGPVGPSTLSLRTLRKLECAWTRSVPRALGSFSKGGRTSCVPDTGQARHPVRSRDGRTRRLDKEFGRSRMSAFHPFVPAPAETQG